MDEPDYPAFAPFLQAVKRPRALGAEVPLLQYGLKRAEKKENPDNVKD
jgi:hypothetical protein